MVGRPLAEEFHSVVDMLPSFVRESVEKQIPCLVVSSCAAYLDVAYADDAYDHGPLGGVNPY